MDGERRMSGRMAKGRHRNNSRRDLRAGSETSYLAGDILEDAPGIEEVALHRTLCRPYVCVVHPEGPFELRHEYLRIRKNLGAVQGLDAVDVIRMKMRDENRIDRFGIGVGNIEIIEQAAGRVGDLTGGSRVNQNHLCSCVHQQGGEGYRQYVRRQECRSKSLIDFSAAGITHQLVIDGQVPDAVEKRGNLKVAQFEAINARP